MIVVDSSALVLALARRGRLGQRAAGAISGHQLHAPAVIDFEVAHAVRGLTLGGKLTPTHGRSVLGLLAAMPITRVPGYPLYDRIWALRDNLSAYDAAYVALAEHLGSRLVTADGRIERANVAHCEVDTIR